MNHDMVMRFSVIFIFENWASSDCFCSRFSNSMDSSVRLSAYGNPRLTGWTCSADICWSRLGKVSSFPSPTLPTGKHFHMHWLRFRSWLGFASAWSAFFQIRCQWAKSEIVGDRPHVFFLFKWPTWYEGLIRTHSAVLSHYWYYQQWFCPVPPMLQSKTNTERWGNDISYGRYKTLSPGLAHFLQQGQGLQFARRICSCNAKPTKPVVIHLIKAVLLPLRTTIKSAECSIESYHIASNFVCVHIVENLAKTQLKPVGKLWIRGFNLECLLPSTSSLTGWHTCTWKILVTNKWNK